MLKTRIIPCLLLAGESLVKTVKYKNPTYIGDPVNTVRIFNELMVDELVFLDIKASKELNPINFELLHQISNECFMPLSYGGGISSLETAGKVLNIGFEKVILNTAPFSNPGLISDIAKRFGSQSVIVSVDVKKNVWGKYTVYSLSGTKSEKKNLIDWIKEVENLGAGEILLTSIDREGTWQGFDTDLIRLVSESTSIPVIAHGGAGSIRDIELAVKHGKASAVALGSMVVFQAKDMGVLVNFPDQEQLETALL